MNSSEIQDSRKFSSSRSNFSQTCNLLSQYMKEKRSLGDLSLGLSTNFQQHGGSSTPTTTKNLLPMIERTSLNMGDPTRVMEPERAQMTIFYAGQVIVLNDFPSDKAKEIMGLASQKPKTYATTVVQKPTQSANNLVAPTTNVVHGPWNNLAQEHSQSQPQPLANDLPIMRNASLARFFEKRKDRITSRAPYQTRNTVGATSRPVENKTWLGLAAQSSQSHEEIGGQL